MAELEIQGSVEVKGLKENLELFDRLMTKDAALEREYRRVIRKALYKARVKLTKDARDYIKTDPRKAALAVKYATYKVLFGGNLSILNKKRSRRIVDEVVKQKKLRPGQRGGNRRPYVKENNRLDKYYGSDRGFILRFISSGTVTRVTRYGKRGSIGASNWFGHVAPWHMEEAVSQIAEAIQEYIKEVANGEK